MNKELRENKMSKYLTYILVMYKAVNLNSFSFNLLTENYIEEHFLVKKK